MRREKSQKIAARVSILFGVMEVSGLVMLLLPGKYMPPGFENQTLFWGLIGAIFGVSRIAAGYAINKNKKWGYVFGLILCIATMVVAPTIIPFGVIDLILAMIITVSLLHAFYGNEKMLQE